jgi:hypothetical protein
VKTLSDRISRSPLDEGYHLGKNFFPPRDSSASDHKTIPNDTSNFFPQKKTSRILKMAENPSETARSRLPLPPLLCTTVNVAVKQEVGLQTVAHKSGGTTNQVPRASTSTSHARVGRGEESHAGVASLFQPDTVPQSSVPSSYTAARAATTTTTTRELKENVRGSEVKKALRRSVSEVADESKDEQSATHVPPMPSDPTAPRAKPKTGTAAAAQPKARAKDKVTGAVPKLKPECETKVRVYKTKGEARGANARAVEQRQLDLDGSKGIDGALELVMCVRDAIRAKMVPLLNAHESDIRAVAETEEGDGDSRAGSAVFSSALLAEFVPLREFCTAFWFAAPANISDERHARERAGRQISNKARAIGIDTILTHPTVSRCIALRDSKQMIHTRWCMLADAIRVAAAGPPHRERYPESAELVGHLANVAASSQLTTFIGDDSTRVDYNNRASFFIPLSLFSQTPRKKTSTSRQPRSRARQRSSRAVVTPSLPDEDAETGDVTQAQSPHRELTKKKSGGDSHRRFADSRRRKITDSNVDVADDDDDDDEEEKEEEPVGPSVDSGDETRARSEKEDEARQHPKKAVSTTTVVRDARAKEDGGADRGRQTKRAKTQRTDEPKEVSGSDTLLGVALSHRSTVAVRAAARVPFDMGALTLQELEEQIKRSALIVQIAQNNALITEANRKAEANGGSRIVDAFM